jgi:mRNA interferase MazF
VSRPRLFRGDVVLTRFPFTDLTGAKLRPAIVVSKGQIGDDLILMAVSSVLRADPETDYTIESSHPEFSSTGLRARSVLRAHKLAAVERSVVTRRLGRLGPGLLAEVDRLLREVLDLE